MSRGISQSYFGSLRSGGKTYSVNIKDERTAQITPSPGEDGITYYSNMLQLNGGKPLVTIVGGGSDSMICRIGDKLTVLGSGTLSLEDGEASIGTKSCTLVIGTGVGAGAYYSDRKRPVRDCTGSESVSFSSPKKRELVQDNASAVCAVAPIKASENKTTILKVDHPERVVLRKMLAHMSDTSDFGHFGSFGTVVGRVSGVRLESCCSEGHDVDGQEVTLCGGGPTKLYINCNRANFKKLSETECTLGLCDKIRYYDCDGEKGVYVYFGANGRALEFYDSGKECVVVQTEEREGLGRHWLVKATSGTLKYRDHI